ncbi:3015_t:CDS:2 [Diversispora eburnea]|uniref:3015_t:CDS:1 n=1 Tax=Diversispora eburnea TaxID=1213867 RepID=A0A9N9AAB1_9GLOM|nr:3015_t:CDS:2 [Diversispora eburnea]
MSGIIINDYNGRGGLQDLDESCPICKNTRYLTPNMKLLVSECYHKILTLRKINFVVPTFEDLSVEKEVRIRKRIAQQFNKRQEDFPSLREYNDYLEMVEDIVWKINNNINKQETDELIERYTRENKDNIIHNARRQIDEEKLAAYKQACEKREKRAQFENYKKSLEQERKAKEELEVELINELTSASKIIAAKKATTHKNPDSFQASHQENVQIKEWFGLDHLTQEDTQEFDPVASEYMDIDHYTIKEKYFIYERSLQSAFSGIFDNCGSSDEMEE